MLCGLKAKSRITASESNQPDSITLSLFFQTGIVRQARTRRGIHGLPKASAGPAMPDPYTPCGRATPQTAVAGVRPAAVFFPLGAGGQPAAVFFPLGDPFPYGPV
jgi:hypothetical protein